MAKRLAQEAALTRADQDWQVSESDSDCQNTVSDPILRPRLHEDDLKTIGTKSYLSGKKEIFPDRPPVYRKTIRIRKLLKTIEKVETFEDDTETIGHRLRVSTISG